MAKAILEFDLSDGDDRMEHNRATRSLDMALALWDIAYNTRKQVEYAVEAKEIKGEEVSPYDVIDMYRELIGEILNKYDVDPDKLVN